MVLEAQALVFILCYLNLIIFIWVGLGCDVPFLRVKFIEATGDLGEELCASLFCLFCSFLQRYVKSGLALSPLWSGIYSLAERTLNNHVEIEKVMQANQTNKPQNQNFMQFTELFHSVDAAQNSLVFC